MILVFNVNIILDENAWDMSGGTEKYNDYVIKTVEAVLTRHHAQLTCKNAFHFSAQFLLLMTVSMA